MGSGQSNGKLCRYLDGMVRSLRKLIPAAVKDWDADAIHDVRVATRRLKAAMVLLGQAAGLRERKAFGKGLRYIRRRHGPLRDLDVMLDHLNPFARGRHAQAAAWLIETLEARRVKLRARVKRRAPARRMIGRIAAWSAMRDDVAAVESQCPDMLAATIPQQMARFRDLADGLGREASHGADDPTVDPHAVRIAGKHLRYALELAAVVNLHIDREILAIFKRMQEALGLWHDFVVLAHTGASAGVETEVAFHRPELFGGLLELSRVLWLRSEQKLRQFRALWAIEGGMLCSLVSKSLAGQVDRPPLNLGVIAVEPSGGARDKHGVGTAAPDSQELSPDVDASQF